MSGNGGGMNTSATRAEALSFQSSVAGAVIPWLRGMHRVPGNLVWYGDFKAHAHTQQQGGKGGGGGGTSTSYTYTSSLVMITAHGPVADIPKVWKGKSQTTRTGLGLTLIAGAIGQATWSGLAGKGAEAIGYSGLAGVAVQNYDLGDSSGVENHSFEVQHTSAYSISHSIPDVDPSAATRELLTDVHRGAGLPAPLLGDWTEWSNYCIASGLLMSPLLLTQVAAHEALQTVVDLTNAAIVWSEGRIKIRPYGDAAITGNGVTFTPDTTTVYQLDDSCYLASNGEAPVRVSLKTGDDRFNSVTVEYKDRSNGYNVATATAKDLTDISVNGVRAMDTVTAHWITEASVARLVAEIKKQRSLLVVGEYTVRLPWHYALIECMDLLTLTDSVLQMQDVPVRVTKIVEESDEELTITCEDYPAGMASAPRYPAQVPAGFATDALAPPPSVADVVLFEPPVEIAQGKTGLEVWCAVNSPGSNWGGCTVWASLDGTTYRAIDRVEGGARVGTLAAPVSSSVALTSVSGQLLNASEADAQALNSLCLIWGTQPEYFAYQTASLTSVGAYTLGGLQRGAYGTASSAHGPWDRFVRIDSAIAKGEALAMSYIGKQLFFKFTSFNLYGAAEQSLADVNPRSYIVTGLMAALPPAQPTGMGAAMEPFGIRFSCAANREPDVVGYEWRVGAAWATAQVAQSVGGTSILWAVQAAGVVTAWVAAVDALGNRSPPASFVATVAAPAVSNFAATLVGADMQLDFSATPGAFAIDSYELRWGDTFASAVVTGTYYVTRLLRRVDWGGARRWWVTARDVKGNPSPPVSLDTYIATPGEVTASRAEVIDNNALLYWAPPATGSLPIDRYEVRKGTSWAAGSTVGSNGNSTFAAIFEQASGQYTYWVAAIDSAGNAGVAKGIPATIAQPPDYVLRVNINSSFTGTLSNFYVEGGALIGPVNAAESVDQHFSNNAWATADDQVNAGYPLYTMPAVAIGSYDEVLDYGAVLPPTIITVTVGSQILAGAVGMSCQIYTKKLAGDAWIAAPANSTSVLASNFQFARVVLTFTCAGGANLIKVNSLNIKLANKLKTDSGTGYANAGDAGGTVMTFGVPFIDADTPMVQPGGLTPLIAVVDFLDQPNPTTFKVYLFDRNGNRVSGPFSWTARGY